MLENELIVDSFAGGGGASEGIRRAIGRGPDIAINHDREAIALHAANHPESVHLAEDVWRVDPVQACGDRPVGLMWLSPDCKHFSKAKGGKPVSKKIRGLAWVALRWAAAKRPRVMALENVEEFQTWGPLHPDDHPNPKLRGRPDRSRSREYFAAFVAALSTGLSKDNPAWAEIRECLGPDFAYYDQLEQGLGYAVEWKELRACDYGAPTIRKRLFLIARCDGQPIVWPAPTHGKNRPQPWRTAAECIQWEIPCPSIFERKKPLADNTLKRIARGLKRFVIDSPNPYIVTYYSPKREGDDRIADLAAPLPTQGTENRFGLVVPYIAGVGGRAGQSPERPLDKPYQTVTAKGDAAVVAPYLVPRYGERAGQEPRTMPLDRPLPTIVPTQNGASLVAAFLAKHFSERRPGEVMGSSLLDPAPTVTTIDHSALVASSLVKFKGTSPHGQPLTEPLHTVQAGGLHYGEVRAFMVAYYGNEKDGGSLHDPMRTVTSKDRLGLVTVEGVDYAIADIGMRMLAPRELYRAQGFPDSYKIEIEYRGKPLTKTAQVRMVGNSVCPPLAAAIVASNVGTPAVEVAA